MKTADATNGRRDTPILAAREPQKSTQRRGDHNRTTLISALESLLTEQAFEDISVAAISRRAGLSRSGFYFYFPSKFGVLAALVDDLTDDILRSPPMVPNAARRIDRQTVVDALMQEIAGLLSSEDLTLQACRTAKHLDPALSERIDLLEDAVVTKVRLHLAAASRSVGLDPLCNNAAEFTALIRVLTAITARTAYGDQRFIAKGGTADDSLRIVRKLWLHALWGPTIINQFVQTSPTSLPRPIASAAAPPSREP